jgi:hypothetical protein
VAGIDLKTRFRHYLHIDRMESRLDRLLRDFRWGRMDEIFLPSDSSSRGGLVANPAMMAA